MCAPGSRTELVFGGQLAGQADASNAEKSRETRGVQRTNKLKRRKKKKGLLGALPREEGKLIAQSAGARGKSTPATKNFNQ